MTVIHYNDVRMQDVSKMDEQVGWDDHICKLIHEVCHKEFYHSDMKSRRTLNTIFSVLRDPFGGF